MKQICILAGFAILLAGCGNTNSVEQENPSEVSVCSTADCDMPSAVGQDYLSEVCVWKDGQWTTDWMRKYVEYCRHKDRFFTEERIKQLEAIGMVWNVNEYTWIRNYESAARYYRRHGSLKVPVSYIDENGIKLYAWLKSMKKEYRNKSKRLSDRQVALLNKIGMVW